MDFRNIESVYNAVVDTIYTNIRKDIEKKVEKDPMLLLEYLKEINYFNIKNASQGFIYKFAKLSVDGYMPLIEEECCWEDAFCKYDKPTFVVPKDYYPECYKEHYDKNPFFWGSNVMEVDGAFELIVQYERNIKFKNLKNKINITLKVDHDIEGHRAFKDNPLYHNEGKAVFVFRIDVNNTEDVLTILDYLKDYIIREKVRNIMSKHFDKITVDIANHISEDILKIGY